MKHDPEHFMSDTNESGDTGCPRCGGPTISVYGDDLVTYRECDDAAACRTIATLREENTRLREALDTARADLDAIRILLYAGAEPEWTLRAIRAALAGTRPEEDTDA